MFTYTILIDGYCNTKRVDEAFGFLDRMKKGNVKLNDVTYRSLVNWVFRSVPAHKALKLLSRWVDMEPDLPKVVYDNVLFCLCNNSMPRDAAVFLKRLQNKFIILIFQYLTLQFPVLLRDWILMKHVRYLILFLSKL